MIPKRSQCSKRQLMSSVKNPVRKTLSHSRIDWDSEENDCRVMHKTQGKTAASVMQLCLRERRNGAKVKIDT
jgi:hypothetical protein